MIKECVVCKNTFEASRSNQMCCCRKCRDKYTNYKNGTKCIVCGSLFHSLTKTSFCSEECKRTYEESKKIKKICEECGEEFLGDSHSRFCSIKCKQSYHRKHDWTVEVECEYCHKKFNKTKYEIGRIKNDKVTKNFCSHSCALAYSYQNNIITALYSKPHQICNKFLDEMNIKYQNEKLFGRFSLDIYLSDFNKGIEIMGTYWHSDSRKYDFSDLEESQRKCIEKDKRKQNMLKQDGIEILYLWQKDILESPDLCKLLIKEFLKDNLKNFHSSSYFLKENKLEFTNIKQFMETFTLND